MSDMQELEQQFRDLLDQLHLIHVSDIPDIDLYMDQVTTFMDQHLASGARNPDSDKILTKTMINNYAKNNLLIPPVNKKYSRDHMVLLILIYYLKSFLSIGDIAAILQPLQSSYTKIGRERQAEVQKRAEKKEKRGQGEPGGKNAVPLELQDIYEEIASRLEEQLRRAGEEAHADFAAAAEDFGDAPAEDQRELQRFDLICRLSMEIYVRKLFIERLIDKDSKEKSV